MKPSGHGPTGGTLCANRKTVGNNLDGPVGGVHTPNMVRCSSPKWGSTFGLVASPDFFIERQSRYRESASSTFTVGRKIFTRAFQRATPSPDRLLIRHAPFPSPRPSLGEGDTLPAEPLSSSTPAAKRLPPHEPGDADGAVGARFVPNRSADVGTGAEPPQRRGLAERCELGTTRAPAPRPVQGLNARNARGNLLPEGEGQDEGKGGIQRPSGVLLF
jgi:hypothetical protein